MASNNTKYTTEMREQTARLIVETGKSATSMAEELGIDKNTVCSWAREYRRQHKLPSYAETKGHKAPEPSTQKDLLLKVRELERENKRISKLLEEEREKVLILKKSLHIFMQPQG
jgi:transposase